MCLKKEISRRRRWEEKIEGSKGGEKSRLKGRRENKITAPKKEEIKGISRKEEIRIKQHIRGNESNKRKQNQYPN